MLPPLPRVGRGLASPPRPSEGRRSTEIIRGAVPGITGGKEEEASVDSRVGLGAGRRG
jgi:hypothetical protein